MVSDEYGVERTEKNMKKKITLLFLSAMLFALSCSRRGAAAGGEGSADRVFDYRLRLRPT